ncbi:hypothetical protein KKH23_08325 [Patescibacteria group bacterium]|nr:hypothetical protein [Patescibacteria group bacterium]
MIFHTYEGNRIITVAYRWTDDINPDNQQIIYGATIHQRISKSDSWLRKDHNKTAIQRCIDHGMMVKPDERTGKELHTFLRNCLFKHGCRAK